MSFNISSKINWIFYFCKSCWDYKKFSFKQNIDLKKTIDYVGECQDCKTKQRISLKEAEDYYNSLNNHNN